MQTAYRPTNTPADRPTNTKKRQRSFFYRLISSWKIYLALLPTFVVLGVLSYYPAFSGLYHAFFDWRPGFDSPFVGFQNFADLLKNSVFTRSFFNIARYFIFGITIAWIIPFLTARMVLTLPSKRWQLFFRTTLIFPMAFPIVVVFFLWSFLYEPNIGLINTFLHTLHLNALARNWLGDPNIALYSLMFIGAPWIASTPFLIFMAGLQAIPSELFDAAAIDGAGWWRCIFFIDLPMLGGQFRLLFVLAIISFIQLAIPMALLTNGGPAYATMTPALYMINTAFVDSEWGSAAAISGLIFVITLALSLIVLRVQRSK